MSASHAGWFRRLPIRKKLLLITMATSLTALVPAAAGFAVFAFFQERSDLRDNAATTAAVIAANTTGALTFDDVDAARSTLGSLAAKTHILSGCLYRDKALFAAYRRPGSAACPPRPGEDGAVFGESTLTVTTPVIVGNQRVGTIYLEGSLEPVYATLRTGLLMIGVLLAVSAFVAFLLSFKLQGLISGPVLSLARTARTVSERRDYSARAIRETEDELGTLVSAFNQMLEQIQERDAELQEAKALLERRVAERTQELELRNEELGQINQDLDDFAYIVSHDLKEPLRGIHNYCAFLIEDYADVLDAEGRKRLTTLARLSRRMEAIIDSLLQYSRVGREEPCLEPVDLDLVLSEVLESLEHGLREKRTEIRVPRPLPTVLCDPAGAAEVFRNLLTNAIKYNDNPERWIEVSWLDGGGQRVFYVRDNGIGIPEKHHEGVFKIFKRLHARDRYGGGTGAGLTIVRKLVERQSGRIWVESVPGHGATFYFTFAGERPGHDEEPIAAHPAG